MKTLFVASAPHEDDIYILAADSEAALEILDNRCSL